MNGYNLPQKWNLYNFTGLPDFDNWDEGAQANAIYNQRKEKLDSLEKMFWRIFKICLIYGKEGFVYFGTYNSTLVAYDKSNIKDVTRERLYLGSSTSGGSSTTGSSYVTDTGLVLTGGSAQTYSNTVNEYEWHLDIFTDFLDYPKVSFVLSDTKSAEEFVGKAYALLKP